MVRPTLTCVEGVGMHRHSARLKRLAGGALVATAIAPWLGGAVANAAAATDPPPAPYTAGIIASAVVVTIYFVAAVAFWLTEEFLTKSLRSIDGSPDASGSGIRSAIGVRS